MRTLRTLAPGSVSVRTDPNSLPETPADIPDRFALLPVRTRRALSLGLTTDEPNFHVFVTAPSALELDHELCDVIARTASSRPSPDDVVYVYDFRRPTEPYPLPLPPGRGRVLAEMVDTLLDTLRRKFMAAGRDETMRRRERVRSKDAARQTRQALIDLEAQAKAMGFGVRSVPGGVQTFPVLHGKPLSPEQFDVLDEGTRERLVDAEEELSAAVEAAATHIRSVTEAGQTARNEALQRTAEELIRQEVASARTPFEDLQGVRRYLDDLESELCKSWRDLVEEGFDGPGAAAYEEELACRLHRFTVNVLVGEDRPGDGAPVVYETDPTPARLFGLVERRADHGTLVSDVSLLRPGSMLRASGGYLVVRAVDLIHDARLWDRFKRTLRTGEMEFTDPLGTDNPFAASLHPLPAPVTPRVVLVGSDDVYEALCDEDPDFPSLFRIKVEVDAFLPRTTETLTNLDGYLMSLARTRGWLPFDRVARARLLDIATRVAGDQERVALIAHPLEETAAFASALARERGATDVSRGDVDTAWEERYDRSSAAVRHLREQILHGEIFLHTDGQHVGVVNGLAVVGAGDVSFGQPMRITAVVSLGNEGLIDVEREAHLGGSIHTKGVSILRGLLAMLFGQERPLSLRAQIVFEQSYGEVDGDSASSSELFAVLSALADVPLDQGVAVTGSLNQLGELQPIGGVCAKVEAFYDLCAARGLTGTQGVLLPASNARHLVLRDDVTDAIAAGTFHLYGARDVWEGIEILSGHAAGRRDEAGRFPADSVFGRVERRIIELAERLRRAEGGGHHDTLTDGRDGHDENPADGAGYRPFRITR